MSFSACIWKYHSFLCFQFLVQRCCVWRLSAFGRLYNLSRVTRRWMRIWSTGGIILGRGKSNYWEKSSPNAVSSTTNHTWAGPESNPHLSVKGTVTKNLNHCTAFSGQFPCANRAEITRSITKFSPKSLQRTRLYQTCSEHVVLEIRILLPTWERQKGYLLNLILEFAREIVELFFF